MKRLVISIVLLFLAAGCWPVVPQHTEEQNQIIERSIRCMFGGECS